MQLQERIALLTQLGTYMKTNDEAWTSARHKAFLENNWFIPEFIQTAIDHIANQYLQETALQELVTQYQIPEQTPSPRKIGIVMPGSTPLAGFHDIIVTFLSGHYALIKLSPRDEALLKHLVAKLHEWAPQSASYFTIALMLKGCDAYIVTNSKGFTNSFDQYFNKYQSLIRKNKTAVAVLTGKETKEELEGLSDDIHLYFGLGTRNVSKLYVPENYDFVPLLQAFNKYAYFNNHHKFKNNYDYNLSIQILNNRYYMTNGSILLTEDTGVFSPISQLHYEFYKDHKALLNSLKKRDDVEGIASQDEIAFGQMNYPAITSFEKGVNTMDFLNNLNK